MINFLRNTEAAAAVEAAIFMPIFMLLTFGISDLGSAMFVRQQANAAAQAGAMYAVMNTGSICATLSSGCQSGIQTAMNDAVGSLTFCTGSVCTASITGCADGSPKCISVAVNSPWTPILPSSLYTWAQAMTVSYTATIRIM